jgi:putative transposase
LKKTQKTNPKFDKELVKKKTEEINDILFKNKAGIESGEIIVLFLDECHLLHGDLTGYVWGQSQIRIEVPITNEKDRQTYLAHSIIKAKNSMFRAIHLVMENQQLNS